MRITIAIPTNRGLQPNSLLSLLKLVNYSKNKHELHCIVPGSGYTIAENRNYTAVQAVRNKSEYLLMVDDDMTFGPDLLEQLLSNQKDICGVAYHSRGSTDKIKLVEDDIMAIAETEKGKYINLTTNPDPKYKDTFECYATGTGVILIKCEVFLKVPQPWFEFTYFDNGKCKEGEDWNFCFKAKDNGYKIYTDPKPEIGHIGEIIYS